MDWLRAQAFLEQFGEADPEADLRENGTNGTGSSGGTDGGNGGHGPRPGGGTDGTANGGGCACGGTGGSAMVAHIQLTAPVTDMTELASRPGTLRGAGPVDPWMIRDLTGQAAQRADSAWCFTITDKHGRPVAHACGKPYKPDKPGTTGPPGPTGKAELTLIERGPPGTYGTWRYRQGNRDLVFAFETLDGGCDHRYQAAGHDPGRHLRHLIGILNAECTFPTCRTPEHQSDNEHSKPFEQGGITCLCACGPMCRRNHRHKQQKDWKIEGTGRPGWFTWTLPSGRTYTTGPTLLPI